MAEKIVPLSKRYEAHGEPFDSVTLREPRFEDLLALGEPYEVQRAAGNNVVIENVDTVAAYVRRCVTAPGIEKLGVLNLADARLVRDAVIGFFMVSASPDAK
ncbi:MAG: hypothetical protein EOR85_13035 [Mesorhizobium sp.]|uniref:hypothetical protein n=1 Tax=Mesorhizobium sp. TaxID=1871066 RepID=UPI000FEA05C6|nr:hypothetical protein [Mesorhizobium sp.]RWK61788.1 MAG: hypothetical protein EOR49_16000 [Mesorhizobium sp.]RWK94538.1 MAG: hypothetical protein EOR53_18190 [Mesorhizobium sp.]RWM47693.1 MAG: hypothetical protein EOR76_14360 [Mesorhizobium sp.]RWN02425.1 MAG: hypothetical protein EOR85_13035 [Mesorhizobium sp.]TIO14060.1 MAG: phage tail assembly protein [Mesorhizobium sp.]